MAESIEPTPQAPTPLPVVLPKAPFVYPDGCAYRKDNDQENLCIEGRAANAAASSALWAALTFGLGIVGTLGIIGTLVYTARAANAAKKAAELAEKALFDLEKPYLIIEFTDPGFRIDVPKTTFEMRDAFKFKWVNAGRGVAILTKHFDKFVLVDVPNLPEPIDVESARVRKLPLGVAIAADKYRKEWRSNFTPIVTRALEERRVFEGSRAIFFQGFIRYQDMMGNAHETGYTAYYEPTGDRFALIGDEKYNYTKTKKRQV